MTSTKKIIIAVIVLAVIGGIAYANFAFKRTTGVDVTAEKIQPRDLEAIVSASGKIQPKKSVQISAETVGKVVNLAVNEGDMVKAGQPLLQIDPRNLETQVQNREASLATAKATLEQTRSQILTQQVALKQAQDDFKRQDGLWKGGLTTKDAYDRAANAVTNAENNVKLAQQSVKTQEERIKAEQANVDSAHYDLTKLRLVSPINGLVTRRNIEEGETVMMGTMNNAGTVLLTIADMSVIEAEVEVDETDIPFVKLGQPAKITIDALTDETFTGKVTEVGNSPIQATGAAAATRATNFKVVVTIDGVIPNVRPGFTCTAVITTATRQKVPAVPIQATTVREVILDEKGDMIRTPPPAKGKAAPKPSTATTELKPGQKRKEIEGVFIINASNQAEFVPIKTGIAGEKYFEVLSGLKEGQQVITGPFASVQIGRAHV